VPGCLGLGANTQPQQCELTLLLPLSLLALAAGENEANVRWLLDTYPELQLVQQAPRLGQPGLTGTLTLPDGSTQQLLTEAEAGLVQRFDPSAELDTIGFFISKFVKAPAAA
jgi:methyltransferase NSUN6